MRGAILAAIAALALLSGCATVSGVGQDLSAGADRVSTWF